MTTHHSGPHLPRGLVLASALLIAWLGPAVSLLSAQTNREAEERNRLELGGLAEGPSILGGGIVVGEPTGFTVKLWFPETAFGADAAVAWSFREESSVYVHANALFHLALIETQNGRYIVPYLGAGIANRFSDGIDLSVRVPVGISILPFPSFPLEFFAELAPGIGVIPETDAEFAAGLGVRFYLPL